ncbi:MAG: lamin tail domain-containing protein [Akkermansiaceae bacterium]|nr:lamin tail domain-containing protein [Akkermansiaceae bacterium]
MSLVSNRYAQWCHIILAITIAPLTAGVVINEIHYDPEPNTEPVEFIELHNTGTSAVDISGWQFTEGVAYTFPAATSIPAGGYLVISEDPAALQAKFGSTALGPWTGKLSNDGEDIILKDHLGTLVDKVGYGVGFPWPLGARGTGSSMELIHPSLDNDLGGSWRAAGEAAVCPGSGSVTTLIPEESVNWKYHKGTSSPAADTNGKTWWQHADYIENANWLTGTASLGYGESFIDPEINDMRGNYSTLFLRKTFTVTDAPSIASLTLKARFDDGVKVWINGTPVFNQLAPGSPATPSAETSLASGNRNESNAHIYTSHTLPDPSSYLVTGTNVIAVQVFNVTLTSSDCHFDCKLEEDTTGSGGGGSSTPSPAARNHSYSTIAAPQTRQVGHSPETPAAGQAVTVTAKVTDPDGVQSVVLKYQTVDPGSYIRRADSSYEDTSNWTILTMVDDGTSGDAVANDDIYSVTVPGSVQSHRRLIRYRITVTDTDNNCMQLPYSDDTQPNFAYFCYNGVPDWTGKINSSSPSVTYTGAELTRLPVYQLIARNPDVENSQWNGSYNEQYFEGTLVYDGKVYDHIKFRNKGSASTYRMGHNKWKLNFGRGHRFQARNYYGKKFDTVWDKFSIQTGESPWWRNDAYPMSGMLFQESLMNRLNNLAGVPAPEMIHFHFRVIDDADESKTGDQYNSDFWGIYTAQQHPDGSFFDENNLPDSNLFKLNNSDASSASRWNLSGTQPDDASDLSAFISGYTNTNDPAWWAANLERHAYYTWNTLNLALNNSDLRAEQNVIYWHNAETDRWHPCVWDVDLLFEDRQHHNRDPYGFPWERLHRMLNHTQYNIEYQNRVRELQDLLFWNGQYDRSIDEIVTILTGSASGVTANTLVDANQAQWDNHSRKVHKGVWYRVENTTYWSGFPAMVDYMKAFAKPGGFGGNQLESKSQADADTNIPDKPTITFTGTAGYPTDGIRLQTSAFSDSSGGVSAIQWRVGEIYDPNVSNYTTGEPWKYEINAVWESGEIVWNGAVTSMDVPVVKLKVGHTYRARVRHKDVTGRWSRWSEPLEFLTTAPDITVYRNALVVSEVHYHPLPPSTSHELGASLDGEDFEFIELMNVGTTTLDLNGVRIADAIGFDFTGSAVTTLAPGATVLVVKDINAFEARYGANRPIAGEYSGKLSNGGELVQIAYGDGNAAANLIRQFTYEDTTPWPTDPDGSGPSMVLVDPWSVPNHNTGSNWRASYVTGGQPGEVDHWSYDGWLVAFGIPGAAADDDPDYDALGLLIEYFLGTDPHVPSRDQAPTSGIQTINPGSGDADFLVITFQRDLYVDDVSFLVQESIDLAGWNTSGTPVLIDAIDQGDGTEIRRYRSSQPIANYPDGNLFMRVKVTVSP